MGDALGQKGSLGICLGLLQNHNCGMKEMGGTSWRWSKGESSHRIHCVPNFT